MFGLLSSLWRYRGFVVSSIRNEFLTRFARSKAGGLWMIIHPLTQVAIYALILSNVLAAKLPGIEHTYAYAIYLMAGFLAWNLFHEILSRCLSLFIDNGNLMKKMVFPRITLPVIVVGSSMINNALLLLAILGVFLLLGTPLPGQSALWLPPLTALVVMFALGAGLFLGVLNVFIRDVGQIVPIALQLLFWLTPIVYPVSIVPDWIKDSLTLNPLFTLVTAYHDVLVYDRQPNIHDLAIILAISTGLLLLSLIVFRRASPEMVDNL